MSLEGAYDTTILDLDQCLMENKTRHRSPIIHLPELFMYGYEYKDVLECANNFKSCSLDKSDDPVVNTVNYYSHKYEGKIAPESLNEILDIIYEHAYAIFHIARDGTTYLASVKEDADDICIDSVCLQWNQMPDQNCDVRVLWSNHNTFMNFEDFSKSMFDKFHSDDYVMNKNLKKILDIDQDVRDNFFKLPYFSYAAEETNDTSFDDFEASLENIDFGFDDIREDEFVLSVATEADGLSDLENMTGNTPQDQPAPQPSGGGRRPRRARRRSQNPVDDLEQMTNDDAPTDAPQQQGATTEDDTTEAREVDIAQMTNDQMEQNGDASSEDQLDGNAEGGDALPEEDLGGDESGDTGLDDTGTDENSEEEDDTKLLNDPESKEVYRQRFIALYKHINDVIDTLERFTPTYNIKCTSDYYNIQNDIHKLKTAIYKICTEKIVDMQTVDVMNAYLTANYAYDSIGEMLKEFFRKYHIERQHEKK